MKHTNVLQFKVDRYRIKLIIYFKFYTFALSTLFRVLGIMTTNEFFYIP